MSPPWESQIDRPGPTWPAGMARSSSRTWAGIPAHVREDERAIPAGQVGPGRSIWDSHGGDMAQVNDDGAAARRPADHVGRGLRRRVCVRHHAAVAIDGHRNRYRGMPLVEPPRTAEVNVFLLRERPP